MIVQVSNPLATFFRTPSETPILLSFSPPAPSTPCFNKSHPVTQSHSHTVRAGTERAEMADFKSRLCLGICALFFGIVVMAIVLIATSLRKLDSDQGWLNYYQLISHCSRRIF